MSQNDEKKHIKEDKNCRSKYKTNSGDESSYLSKKDYFTSLSTIFFGRMTNHSCIQVLFLIFIHINVFVLLLNLHPNPNLFDVHHILDVIMPLIRICSIDNEYHRRFSSVKSTHRLPILKRIDQSSKPHIEWHSFEKLLSIHQFDN